MELTTVVMQITTRCPLNCPQCYMKRGQDDMPLKTAFSIIEEAKLNGAKMIQLTGGEPASYPHINRVISYAEKAGLLTTLSTSGYGLGLEELQKLKNSGLTALCVSLNGFKRTVSEHSRNGLDYAVSAVETAKNLNFLTFINFVARKDNIYDLENLIYFARKNGVFKINILKNQKNHQGVLDSALTPDDLNFLAKLVKKQQGYLNVENCYFDLLKSLGVEKIACDALKTSYFVNVNGAYSPCSKNCQLKYKNLTDLQKAKGFCCT